MRQLLLSTLWRFGIVFCAGMIGGGPLGHYTVEAKGVKGLLSSKSGKDSDKSNKSKSNEQDSPLRIVSDEMTCDQKTNICVANGNAFAEKLNVPDSDKKTISAERFVAHFKKKDEEEGKGHKKRKSLFDKKDKSSSDSSTDSKTSLEKLEAFGNVVMTDPQSIIRSDEAVYHTDSETVDLAGNVSLTQGKNQLTGTHGHANLRDGTYKVTNESGRVEALFYQKKKDD